ncbi:hypothetical protein GCM10010912_11310 [Paenibacillus albidus]|uniref:Uncharacterized protein n=1 Tax=Paenibacillus albidus TaxID=2041023 RepID=A0A917C2V3_9BACL|nr:hypothetical protein GCM10010912_11310 [Paenibacillus albidus]
MPYNLPTLPEWAKLTFGIHFQSVFTNAAPSDLLGLSTPVSFPPLQTIPHPKPSPRKAAVNAEFKTITVLEVCQMMNSFIFGPNSRTDATKLVEIGTFVQLSALNSRNELRG